MFPFREQPWAKLDRDDDKNVIAALPLADHCLDVAAVFEALLRAGAWDRAVASTAARPLSERDIARLTVLAALHDIGKVNAGFHARWNRHAPKVGHEGEVAALLLDPALRQTAAAKSLLGPIQGSGGLSARGDGAPRPAPRGVRAAAGGRRREPRLGEASALLESRQRL